MGRDQLMYCTKMGRCRDIMISIVRMLENCHRGKFIDTRRENHEVFSFVDESPGLLLSKKNRENPLTQKTLLAQVVRIPVL